MKKWEYRKGCEDDFAGHDAAYLVVKSGRTGEIFYLSKYYAGRIEVIEGCGDIVIAYREPITDEKDLNDCIGAPEADNKYLHEIKPGIFVDVYDVLMAWNVTNPALQHLIKKALQAGDRGHKSREQDLQDIIDSAIRAKELENK
ncbi:hypothetical protein KGB50_gp58 [Shigella phage DS8]|uniref:Uncharacterized protein n=1 Tax=Shigella phage DS8 TaxID=2565502 RepID=A0A4P8MTR6_9CAUD|nr:hypothetical protein KGB50_gp58 [Shigella phage DS8]QCQ57341.1 hypothetical protein [Shigella phage DS8]